MYLKRLGSICTGFVCLASVSSCVVDDAYNFSKFNSEMTLVPGLSVPIPENMNTNSSLNASELLNLGSSFNTGNGAYEARSEAKATEIITEAELTAGARMDDIMIRFTDIPAGLDIEKTQIFFDKVPVTLALTNPTGVPVKLDAVIKAGKNSKAVSWILTESAELQVKEDIDISDILTTIPESVTLADIKLTSIGTKAVSGSARTSGSYRFDFSAVSTIPLKFKPKSVLVFSTPLKDITTDLSSLNLDATKAVVTLVVNSTFPLSIEGSAKADGVSVVMSRLNANAKNQEVKIEMDAEKGIKNLSDLLISVKAENDSDKVAVIDERCTLDVKIKEVTLPDGISVK